MIWKWLLKSSKLVKDPRKESSFKFWLTNLSPCFVSQLMLLLTTFEDLDIPWEVNISFWKKKKKKPITATRWPPEPFISSSLIWSHVYPRHKSNLIYKKLGQGCKDAVALTLKKTVTLYSMKCHRRYRNWVSTSVVHHEGYGSY